MKYIVIFLLFCFLCLSAHGATLEFAFQLGEKQTPRLDRLLPDVAQHIAFNKFGTRLIAKGMENTFVSWDIKKREKQITITIPNMHCFAFSKRLVFLLLSKSDDVVVTVDLIEGCA